MTCKAVLKNRSSQVKIISKIEDREGLSNIEEICKVSDAVMVARGDLGIETDLSIFRTYKEKIMSNCYSPSRAMIENPIQLALDQ